jgi:hypothetical protein
MKCIFWAGLFCAAFSFSGVSAQAKARLCSYTHQMLRGFEEGKGAERSSPFLKNFHGTPMLNFLAKGSSGLSESVLSLGGVCGKEVGGRFFFAHPT